MNKKQLLKLLTALRKYENSIVDPIVNDFNNSDNQYDGYIYVNFYDRQIGMLDFSNISDALFGAEVEKNNKKDVCDLVYDICEDLYSILWEYLEIDSENCEFDAYDLDKLEAMIMD